jgi:putative transposase
MPHSYSKNTIHLIFSTKNRLKTIAPTFQPELWNFSAGICKNEHIHVHAIGGIEDHIHFLIQIPATQTISHVVCAIKANSARFANRQNHPLEWQEGYAAFSVSASQIPSVTRYICQQSAHHQKISFEQEFLALLAKHRIAFDPRFVLG